MWKNEFRVGFKEWRDAGHKETPMKTLFTLIGSTTDPFDMVNAEAKLNNMKTVVCDFIILILLLTFDLGLITATLY